MSLSDDYLTFLRSSLGFDVRLGPAGRHIFPSKPLPKGSHLIESSLKFLFFNKPIFTALFPSNPIHLIIKSVNYDCKHAGTDILEESALVSVVAQSERRDRCAYCFNQVPRRFHCGACKQEFYCGVTCQVRLIYLFISFSLMWIGP
jgi:hypothetical protein